jgi:hypothetical protein
MVCTSPPYTSLLLIKLSHLARLTQPSTKMHIQHRCYFSQHMHDYIGIHFPGAKGSKVTVLGSLVPFGTGFVGVVYCFAEEVERVKA